MSYQVIIQPPAFAEIETAYRWMCDYLSADAANQWYYASKMRSHPCNSFLTVAQLHLKLPSSIELHYYQSSGFISPSTTTNPTPQRVAASANLLSSVAIGNRTIQDKLH